MFGERSIAIGLAVRFAANRNACCTLTRKFVARKIASLLLQASEVRLFLVQAGSRCFHYTLISVHFPRIVPVENREDSRVTDVSRRITRFVRVASGNFCASICARYNHRANFKKTATRKCRDYEKITTIALALLRARKNARM